MPRCIIKVNDVIGVPADQVEVLPVDAQAATPKDEDPSIKNNLGSRDWVDVPRYYPAFFSEEGLVLMSVKHQRCHVPYCCISGQCNNEVRGTHPAPSPFQAT